MIDREFRVGDKVTCVLFGKGIIERISVKFLDVKFENGIQEVYYKDGKYTEIMNRTLFILPKVKPTLKQIKEKFKQLLDEVEEVKFKYWEGNYTVQIENDYKNKTIECYFYYDMCNEYINKKYISKQNAERIVEEMNEFIKGE